MKILQLQAENIKRLKAIDITPTDDCVIISGKNENGKSSILDSIWLALQYKSASKNNPVPLRVGTDKGFVTLDLGDYIVTRKFTEKDNYLEIKTPEGSKITSPQKLLDGLIGDLSFDPYAFLRLSEPEQKQTLGDVLFKLTDGKVDLASFEQRYQQAYEERTELNRESKRLETLVTGFKQPTDADPKVEISSKDILDDLEIANKINRIQNKIDVRNFSIGKLEAEITALKIENDTDTKQLNNLPNKDIVKLQGQLQDIEQINKRAREVIQYNKLLDELQFVNNSLDKISKQIELIQIEKDEALEDSPLPIDGLIIDADGIKIDAGNGDYVPLKQASTARGLKIALAIAMAANPTLRVIRISDASTLDDDSLKIIKDMAKDEDYQIWVEIVSKNEKDRPGIYIEDGQIV